jgi:hypothetical protein
MRQGLIFPTAIVFRTRVAAVGEGRFCAALAGSTSVYQETRMKRNLLVASALAAAFAVFPSVSHAQTSAPSNAVAAPVPSSSTGASSAVSGPVAGAMPPEVAAAHAAFQELDRDQDGYLTRAEVQGTPLEAVFTSLDTDGDGAVSSAEYAAAPR